MSLIYLFRNETVKQPMNENNFHIMNRERIKDGKRSQETSVLPHKYYMPMHTVFWLRLIKINYITH